MLVTGALAGGWWLWRNKITDSARLNFITVSVNHDIRKILSGETLSLHPNDRIKVLSISTNIPLNLNIRMSAEGLDVNALQYEALTISELLPQREAFDRYRFLIRVKHYNEDIGDVIWVVQPYTEDWLDKANRIIDSDRRIAFLEHGQHLSPENSQLNRRLLDEYRALKKWKEAAGMLERMAAKKEDKETLSELLEAYREMKDKNGIILILKKLIILNPDDLENRKALAETLEGTDDWTGAIQEYEDLLKHMDEGERLDTYKSLGFLHTKTQNYEKAISCYLNAAKLDQKDANLHYNLSYLYEKTGQKEKANFYLDNAITLKSGDLDGRLKLARNLMEKGEYKKARKYLSEVLKKKPDSSKALTLMAEVLEKQGDKKALKTIYLKMLSLNPKDDTIIYNLGALEYEDENLQGALPHFKTYVTSHPKDANVHGILFDIYQKEKDLPSALKEAIILVDLRPKETDVYDFIFDYLRQKKKYKMMIPLLQKGVNANPGETTLRGYLISAYLKTGKDDQAIRQMEEILREKPKDISLLLQDMFESLRTRGVYEKIVHIMKKAVKAYPRSATFREYLIFACLKTGKDAQAMEQMEEILKMRPKDLDLWLHLAKLREKNNDIAGAAKAYKRVIDISPEHSEASEAYLRLRLRGVGGSNDE